MRTYKFLLLGLLFLISLSLIFNFPGIGILETFNNLSTKQVKSCDFVKLATTFSRYPPGVFAIFSSILIFFSPDRSIVLFYKQTAWTVHKFALFTAYIFTWLALLYLIKSVKTSKKISFLDVSLAFFASVSILLLSVALTYFNIFAAPFFLLSLTFLFKRKFNLAGLFYLTGLIFDWTLLVFALPFFFHYKRLSSIKVVPFFTFLIAPIMLLGFLPIVRSDISQTVVFGFPWFINEGLLGLAHAFFVGAISVAVLGFLLKNLYFQNINSGRKKYLIYLIPIILFLLPLFWVSSLMPVFIFLFLLIYFRLYSRFWSAKRLLRYDFVATSFSLYLVFILFFPGVSPGALLWLTVLALVLFILRDSLFTRLKLLIVNLLVFFNVFVFFGTAGLPPVRGEYFEFFRLIFGASFIIFAAWYISFLYRQRYLDKFVSTRFTTNALSWMKTFAVVFLVLLNVSLIPAQGSSDTVSWTQYTVAITEHGDNPFLAQTVVDQRYPPLSTVILGFFATLWKNLIGVSKTYAISTKISIFVLYLLTVISYLKFGVATNKKKALSQLDKLLIILTTFSLIIQTQGLADLNVYILPPLFAAIVALKRKKYFLSGVILGITISIKWQPVILIPLFGATLFNFDRNIKVALKRSLLFLFGFLPIPMIAWYLVLIQPGGLAAIQRSFDYLFHGAPMLSGQALNLNWIATYLIHIFQPEKDVSLAHLGGLNRQIPTGIAPTVLQGYLFLFVGFMILLRYWLFQKKDLARFLSAAVMIFFSHHILNKSAYEKHLFYTVALMLFLYLIRPTRGNRNLVILFDIMTIMNLVFFYGFTGDKWFNRLFFGVDLTVIFAAYYVVIFIWVFWRYLRRKGLLFG